MNSTILILIICIIYFINFIEPFVLTENSRISVAQSDNSLTTITPPLEFKTDTSFNDYTIINKNNSSLMESEARKKKEDKDGKKLQQYFYPVIIGLFIAKTIIFPLILKALTIMSSASLVFSKMALLTSILLGMKWFLTNNHMYGGGAGSGKHADNSRVEIVHIPINPIKKSHDWDRENDKNMQFSASLNENYDQFYNEHDVIMKPTPYI